MCLVINVLSNERKKILTLTDGDMYGKYDIYA